MADDLSLSNTEIQTPPFVNDVYHWMLYGLSLTGLIAWWASNQAALIKAMFQNPRSFILFRRRNRIIARPGRM